MARLTTGADFCCPLTNRCPITNTAVPMKQVNAITAIYGEDETLQWRVPKAGSRGVTRHVTRDASALTAYGQFTPFGGTMPFTISVAPEAGNVVVVVVGPGLAVVVVVVLVVVVVGTVVAVVFVRDLMVLVVGAGTVVVGAGVVVVFATVVVVRGTDVVVVSNTCGGAPASCALPRKIARIAFMFEPVSCGTITALPLMFLPDPSI